MLYEAHFGIQNIAFPSTRHVPNAKLKANLLAKSFWTQKVINAVVE